MRETNTDIQIQTETDRHRYIERKWKWRRIESRNTYDAHIRTPAVAHLHGDTLPVCR